MEDCMPCGFGLTSADGSMSQKQCKAVSQPCPPGQWAAPDAVSAEQCRCYHGYGGALWGLWPPRAMMLSGLECHMCNEVVVCASCPTMAKQKQGLVVTSVMIAVTAASCH